MLNSEDRQLVEKFWERYVYGFIFGDLTRSARCGRANFLVALGLMCYTDYFGKLMTGKQDPHRNFCSFLKEYLPAYSMQREMIYKEVRCGLVHEYFPVNLEVIGRKRVPLVPPSIWQESGRWKIAVDDFIEDLKEAANKFKQDLLNGVHFSEFKKVVEKNPGLNRIL